jgi:putative DNA primase/helicase
LSGVRFIPEKIPFCSSARKALDTAALRDKYGGPPMEVKNVRLPFSRNEQNQVKMWIPAKNGPGEGDKIGEWAVRAMDTFESCLINFKGGNVYEN